MFNALVRTANVITMYLIFATSFTNKKNESRLLIIHVYLAYTKQYITTETGRSIFNRLMYIQRHSVK